MTMPESALPSTADLLAMIPYAATLGITLDEATPQRTRGRLPWSPGLCTTGGVMNGGAIISLADNIGALCAFLNLPAGAGTTVTLDAPRTPSTPARRHARINWSGSVAMTGNNQWVRDSIR